METKLAQSTSAVSRAQRAHETSTYVVTLRDAGNRHETRPLIIRLRAALKMLLRSFGLRCTSVAPGTNPTVAPNDSVTR